MAKARGLRAVVPVAGIGSRLLPLTRLFPKELLPLGRKLVLDYVVEELERAEVHEALFILSPRKPQIRTYLEEINPPKALKAFFAMQEEPKGSGDALLYAEEWVGEGPFVVAFGDCILDSKGWETPLIRLLADYERCEAEAGLLVEEVPLERVTHYGVVAPKNPEDAASLRRGPFFVRDVVEKPTIAEAPSRYVVAARWILSPRIFQAIRENPPDSRGEWNVPDALRRLLQRGARVIATPLQSGEARRDIGNWESFLCETVRAALKDPEYGAAVRGIVKEERFDRIDGV